MNSSEIKILDAMKKRFPIFNRNNKYLNMKKIYPTTIYKITKKNEDFDTNTSESNKSIKNTIKKLILKDEINLKLIPLIKKKKCVFKYENLIMKKNKDDKSKNRISTSFGDKCSKSYSKRFVFKSPFQEGKAYKYILRDIVNLSKRFHSPKYKEKELHRDILKTYSRNDTNNFFRISKNNKNKYLNTWGNTKNIFNIKIDKNRKESNDITKNENEEDLSENIFLRNIIINRERNRIGKNYYNQIHLKKMNKIIEKFSFNNKS